MDCLKPIIDGCGTPTNFAEKTFADGSQTSKSAKVFSLESFPLYGMYSCTFGSVQYVKLHKISHKLVLNSAGNRQFEHHQYVTVSK